MLACIERHAGTNELPRVRLPAVMLRPVEAEMKDIRVVPLRHHALLSYLHSRMIDADIGKIFCKEVHYELRKRHYFGLAFCNLSGGYEVRNPYYKGCLKNKDVSLISHTHGETQGHVCVFCLLYTSDAADDLLCVDLVGRRINKKKNTYIKHIVRCRRKKQ